MSAEAGINQRANQAASRIESRLSEHADDINRRAPDAFSSLSNRLEECRRLIDSGEGLAALRLLEPMDLEITRLSIDPRKPVGAPASAMPVIASYRPASPPPPPPPPPIEMTAAARLSDASESRRSLRPPTVPDSILRTAAGSGRQTTIVADETPGQLLEKAFQALKDNADLLKDFGTTDMFALKDRLGGAQTAYEAAPDSSQQLIRRLCADVFAEVDAARARASEADSLKKKAQDIYRLSLEHKERLGVRFLTIQSTLEKFADAIERNDLKTCKRLLDEASSRFDLARRTTQIIIKK